MGPQCIVLQMQMSLGLVNGDPQADKLKGD